MGTNSAVATGGCIWPPPRRTKWPPLPQTGRFRMASWQAFWGGRGAFGRSSCPLILPPPPPLPRHYLRYTSSLINSAITYLGAVEAAVPALAMAVERRWPIVLMRTRTAGPLPNHEAIRARKSRVALSLPRIRAAEQTVEPALASAWWNLEVPFAADCSRDPGDPGARTLPVPHTSSAPGRRSGPARQQPIPR